jgi:CDP-diacylglycerol--glycerol-3-phosphate 3-phosphatidyltransferase
MLKQVPNILTFGRGVLTILFLVMLLYSPYVSNRTPFIDAAFVIFVIAGLTDIVDGPIARKLNVTSKFGRMLDPLADKVLVCGAFVCFAFIGEPLLFNLSPAILHVIRWSVAAVLIGREGYVTILRHVAEAKGIDFRAVTSGKIKMLIQSFAIGAVLVKAAHVRTAIWGHWFITITFAVMLTVTIISGLSATRRTRLGEGAEP